MLKAMLSCSCNHNVAPACITADRHEGEPGVSYMRLESGRVICVIRSCTRREEAESAVVQDSSQENSHFELKVPFVQFVDRLSASHDIMASR